MLNNFRIVLVRTTHAGNIGAAARAMKTMGVSDLVLVAPENFDNGSERFDEARARSAGAVDIFDNARIVASLEDAIVDCHFVAGTSTRQRSIPWPHLSLADAGSVLTEEVKQGSKIAIVFGREEHGLTNAELALCSQHMSIDANPDYPVMNLAAAVQVVCYELRQLSLNQQPLKQQSLDTPSKTVSLETAVEEWDQPRASMDELEKFYQHFEQTLLDLDYIKTTDSGQLMTRVRRLFNRALPDKLEISLLRGMLAKAQKATRTNGDN